MGSRRSPRAAAEAGTLAQVRPGKYGPATLVVSSHPLADWLTVRADPKVEPRPLSRPCIRIGRPSERELLCRRHRRDEVPELWRFGGGREGCGSAVQKLLPAPWEQDAARALASGPSDVPLGRAPRSRDGIPELPPCCGVREVGLRSGRAG